MKQLDKQYTILLLSAPIGSGHILAAEALQQVLEQNPSIRVIHGNVFSFFPHCLGQLFLKSYLWVLDVCPWMYAVAYKWGNKESGSLWLRNLLNGVLARLGAGYIKKVRPDAVIATHATPAGIMSIYKESHPDLWLGAVVTDFTIHRWWLCDGVDTYFIADERLRAKLVGSRDVQAFGIPVRQQFLNNEREHFRKLYRWNASVKVCLLMGGGEGLLPMADIAAELRKQQGLHLVAITGRNEGLAEQLRKLYPEMEVYGFRDDVPQMMSAADMVITKAGGLTAAEVLSCGLEFIIYKPLPGQEEGNSRFLEQYRGAHIAHDIAVLARIVAETAENKGGKAYHGKPQAARNICDYVLNKVCKH